MEKIRFKMSASYDIKVRGVLCTGKRGFCEMEILGRSLRWTEEGLEYEASDRHHQALPQGMGLCSESKMVRQSHGHARGDEARRIQGIV